MEGEVSPSDTWDTKPPTRTLRALEKPEQRTAHHSVKNRIRSAILANELPAGTRLVQSELARAFGVSSTPVREAMRDLCTEGIIDFDAFRGAVVHSPTTTELENVYAIRSQLMPLSVSRGVVRITQSELTEVKEILERMQETKLQTEWVDLNRQFHKVLDGASGDHHLSTILERLADISTLYVNISVGVRASRRESAEDEHRELYDAYAMGCADLALKISLRHLRSTVEAAKAAQLDHETSRQRSWKSATAALIRATQQGERTLEV